MRLWFWRRLDNLAVRLKWWIWIDRGRTTPVLVQRVVSGIDARRWCLERVEARKRGAKDNE